MKKIKAWHCMLTAGLSLILGAIFMYIFWPVALGFGVLALIAGLLADYKLPKIV